LDNSAQFNFDKLLIKSAGPIPLGRFNVLDQEGRQLFYAKSSWVTFKTLIYSDKKSCLPILIVKPSQALRFFKPPKIFFITDSNKQCISKVVREGVFYLRRKILDGYDQPMGLVEEGSDNFKIFINEKQIGMIDFKRQFFSESYALDLVQDSEKKLDRRIALGLAFCLISSIGVAWGA